MEGFTMTRVCRDCGEEKTLSTEFFERRSDNGLYRHICLSCLRASQRDRYMKAHKEKQEAIIEKQKLEEKIGQLKNMIKSEKLKNLIFI